MKRATGKTRRQLFVDFGWDSIGILSGGRGIEIPLERDGTGALEPAERAAVVSQVREFLRLRRRGSTRRAICALPARGVSLRRLSLPAVPSDERDRILALQVEREFPLGPAEIVWGHGVFRGSGNGVSPPEEQEVVVAAMRADLLDGYRDLLGDCGIDPRFGLGAIAASRICPGVQGLCAVLDIGRTQSELLIVDGGVPVSVRSLAAGGDDVTRVLADRLGISRRDAETAKRMSDVAESSPEVAAALAEAVDDAASRYARWIEECCAVRADAAADATNGVGARWPERVYLVGDGARLVGLPRAIEAASGVSLECESIVAGGNPGQSAVNLGLRRHVNRGGVGPDIEFAASATRVAKKAKTAGASARVWILLAIALAAGALALRYAGPLWKRDALESRLAAARIEREMLPVVDLELDFLRTLEAGQLPYLEAVTVLANLAPKGTAFHSLTINRRGDLTFEGRVPKFEMVNAYRAKIATCGWFRNVVLHEQAASKDKKRKGIIFRLSAAVRVDPTNLPPMPQPVGAPAAANTKPAESKPAAPVNTGLPPPPPPSAGGAKPSKPAPAPSAAKSADAAKKSAEKASAEKKEGEGRRRSRSFPGRGRGSIRLEGIPKGVEIDIESIREIESSVRIRR